MEAVHSTRIVRTLVALVAAIWTTGIATAAAQTNPVQIENVKVVH